MLLKLLEALLNWSGFKVDYIYKHNNGRYTNIHFRYKARKYSPVFWLYCACTFPSYWFLYGFADTIEGIKKQLEYQPSRWIEFYHPPKVNRFTRVIRNFVKVYSYSNV